MASPEDKEMKKQWITVDGRQTPIILPQIWDHDKEEWIVTGTNNPLPTQVTGSIVEVLDERNLNAVIADGEEYTLINNKKAMHINVTGGVRLLERSPKFELRFYPQLIGGYTIVDPKTLQVEDAIRTDFTFRNVTNAYNLRLYNNSGSSLEIESVSILESGD